MKHRKIGIIKIKFFDVRNVVIKNIKIYLFTLMHIGILRWNGRFAISVALLCILKM